MDYIIPAGNWTTYLAQAIEQAAEGDTIVVADESVKELAKLAIGRMRPDSHLQIVIRPHASPFRD